MANYNTFPAYAPYYPAPAYQQPAAAIQQAAPSGIIWVDGEAAAKAQQIPPGWDVSKPLPLWDTNDQIIYLKSVNQMGMPNPLTKLHYTIEETNHKTPADPPDMSAYATKEDLEALRAEIRALPGREARKNG